MLVPWLALPEFASDTLAIVRESDFIFHQEEAVAHEVYMNEELLIAEIDSKDAEIRSMNLEPEEYDRWCDARDQHYRACKKDIDTLFPHDAYETAEEGYYTPWDQAHLKPRCENGEKVGVSTTVYVKKQRPSWSDFDQHNISPDLLNVVHTCNYAAKTGVDGFLWLSYNTGGHWKGTPKPGTRITAPSTGAFCTAITTQCARKLLGMGILNWPDTHTGSLYKKICKEGREHLSAGYIWPPIGHYYTHPSTSFSSGDEKSSGSALPLGRVLKAHYEQSWVVDGSDGRGCPQKGRWIAKWTDKGQPAWTHCKAFDAHENQRNCYWRTQAPPGTPSASLYEQPKHLGDKDFLLRSPLFFIRFSTFGEPSFCTKGNLR